MTKAKSDKHLRTEKAIRAAVKRFALIEAYVARKPDFEIEIREAVTNAVLAIADLRDLYRKRKPLKGIGKKLTRLVRTGK